MHRTLYVSCDAHTLIQKLSSYIYLSFNSYYGLKAIHIDIYTTSNSFYSRIVSFLTGASVWHCIVVCRRLAIMQCSALADTYVVISVLKMIFGHACRAGKECSVCVWYNNICVCVSRSTI